VATLNEGIHGIALQVAKGNDEIISGHVFNSKFQIQYSKCAKLITGIEFSICNL